MKRWIPYLLASSLVVGCGLFSKGKGGLGPENPSGSETARAIDSWKSQLIKRCEASAAAGHSQDAGDVIDLRVLFEKTGKSTLFNYRDAYFFLPSFSWPIGESQSTLESRVEINGRSDTVALRAERQGGRCALYSGDTKLYETEVAAYASVQVLFAPLPEDKAFIEINAPIIEKLEQVHSLNSHRLTDLAEPFTRAGVFPTEVLSEWAGISKEDSERFFKPNEQGTIDRSHVSIIGESVSEFSATSPTIFAALSSTNLLNLFDGRQLKVQYLVAPPQFGATNPYNELDQELLTLEYLIQFRKGESEQRRQLHIVGFNQGAARSKTVEAYKQCAEGRLDLLLNSVPALSQRYPDYFLVTAPCSVLTVDRNNATFEDTDLRSMVLDRFAAVDPAQHRQGYDNWDVPLRMLASRCAREQGKIRECLGPDSGGQLVMLIDRYFAELNGALHHEFALSTAGKDLSLDLAFAWSSKGTDVRTEIVVEIARAISNASVELAIALPRLISEVQRLPNHSREITQFAIQVGESYKTLFQKIAAKADSLGILSQVESKVLAGALVERTPESSLESYPTTLDAIGQFVDEEGQRAIPEEFRQKNALESIVRQALNELWTAREFSLVSQISELAKYSTWCERQSSVSMRINCMSLSHLSTKPKNLLSADYNGRYGDLARDFAKYMADLKDDFLASDLRNSFPAQVLWKSCDDATFGEKRGKLKSLIETYLKAEFFRRSEQRQAIDIHLRDCRN